MKEFVVFEACMNMEHSGFDTYFHIPVQNGYMNVGEDGVFGEEKKTAGYKGLFYT